MAVREEPKFSAAASWVVDDTPTAIPTAEDMGAVMAEAWAVAEGEAEEDTGSAVPGAAAAPSTGDSAAAPDRDMAEDTEVVAAEEQVAAESEAEGDIRSAVPGAAAPGPPHGAAAAAAAATPAAATRFADDPALLAPEWRAVGDAHGSGAEPQRPKIGRRQLPSVARLQRERAEKQREGWASIFAAVRVRTPDEESADEKGSVTAWGSALWAGAVALSLRRKASRRL